MSQTLCPVSPTKESLAIVAAVPQQTKPSRPEVPEVLTCELGDTRVPFNTYNGPHHGILRVELPTRRYGLLPTLAPLPGVLLGVQVAGHHALLGLLLRDVGRPLSASSQGQASDLPIPSTSRKAARGVISEAESSIVAILVSKYMNHTHLRCKVYEEHLPWGSGKCRVGGAG